MTEIKMYKEKAFFGGRNDASELFSWSWRI